MTRNLVSGPFRLDLTDERLWRGDEVLPLGGKAFALLRALMESPQVLLTKEELFDRVWPGLAVSESVLTTAVKDVRRALGDAARQPTVIETVHGRGYRYLLSVEASDQPVTVAPAAPASPPAPPARSRRWLLLAGIGASAAACAAAVAIVAPRLMAPPPDKSVAVLPFADLSAGHDQGWFADGLTEEVLNTLARTPDLRVVARQSSNRFRASREDSQEIARRLNVAHVLEGSIRRADERLRVTVSLVRGADGDRIWSKTYDRRGPDVISIQEDIAFDIARALKTVMEPAKLRAMVSAGTRSVEAYEAYLRGLALDQRQQVGGDVKMTLAAGEAYDQARALDPDFAAAHWRAAYSWFGNATRIDAGARAGVDPAERRRQFEARINAAIATSKDEVSRLKYGSAAAADQLRLKAAFNLMARYLEARPRDLEAWSEMADLAGYVGERRWVARSAERLHAISMEDRLPYARAITVSVLAQDPAVAARRAHEQLALRADNAVTQYQAHRALIGAGQIAEGRTLTERVRQSSLPAGHRLLVELRQACAEQRVADAAALRQRIEAEGTLASRWHAASLMSDTAGAEALLRPYDNAQGLSTLMQFLVYPNFDAGPFPTLNTLLTREAVARPPPAPLPFACKTPQK